MINRDSQKKGNCFRWNIEAEKIFWKSLNGKVHYYEVLR